MSLCRLLFFLIVSGYCVFASNGCVLVVTHEPYAENLITIPNKEGVEIFPGRSIHGSLRPFNEKYGLLLHDAEFYDSQIMKLHRQGTSWDKFVQKNRGKYAAIIFDAASLEYFLGTKTYRSILSRFDPEVVEHAHDNFCKLFNSSGGVVFVEPDIALKSSVIKYFEGIGLRFEGDVPLSDMKPQYRDILGRLNPKLNVEKRSSGCCVRGKETFVWQFAIGSGFANPLVRKSGM